MRSVQVYWLEIDVTDHSAMAITSAPVMRQSVGLPLVVAVFAIAGVVRCDDTWQVDYGMFIS
jgi:hypothetical protein